MASGTIGTRPQADDVDFASNREMLQTADPEPNCVNTSRVQGCTDPFFAPLYTKITANRGGPLATPFASKFYPARRGHDQFYGYGRANIDNATTALLPAGPTDKPFVPPSVEITSPDWFTFVDPTRATAAVGAQISTRPGLSYKCKVFAAPGSYPEDNVPGTADGGDFKRPPGATEAPAPRPSTAPLRNSAWPS